MAVTRAASNPVATPTQPPAYQQHTQDTQRSTQQATQKATQSQDEPELEEVDVADVICILHPCSLAAYQVVVNTATRSPQHVLQNVTPSTYSDGLSVADLEKEDTFLAAGEDSRHPLDLALRMSAKVNNPAMGFVFGRSQACDVVIDTDTVKRVSNTHFRIYMTEAGVCMLHDMSTNGTLVDGKLLRGRGSNNSATMMLSAGSVIQILSTKREESLKFIFRVPSRESHFDEYGERFTDYINRLNIERAKQAQEQGPQGGRPVLPGQQTKPLVNPVKPILLQQNPFGMHWNGGDKYNVTGHLGKGAFATVYRLNSKADGQLFAAKELEKRRFMKNGILDKKLDMELHIMRDINHPHVVQYVDYHDVKNHLYIIMELVPYGDLGQWLNTKGPLPESLAKPMAAQVFDALGYLHRKMITHRDIKPDNILIADNSPNSFSVKLSDFGLSKVISDNETFLKTFCGTLLYCAPEVFPHYDAHATAQGRKRDRKGIAQRGKYSCYSSSVDIWSFGGVLWYAMSSRPPFEGIADHTGRAMFDRIISTPLDFNVLLKFGISDEAMDIIEDMLNTDPAQRPSALQCLTYPWFGGNPEEIKDEPEPGLVTIAEEDADTGAAPDLSQLSIHGQQNNMNGTSLDFSDPDSLDPRQSKRFKSGVHTQDASSPGAVFNPTVSGVQELVGNPQSKPLFGEIQPSGVQSSGVFGKHTQQPVFAPDAPDMNSSHDLNKTGNQDLFTSAASRHRVEEGKEDSKGQRMSTDDSHGQNLASLVGAESEMRDLHMDSSQSAASGTGDLSEPTTPTTPNDPHQASVGQSESNLDETPRPPQPTDRKLTFDRQISLPLSSSSFYEHDDSNTHSLDYVSSIGGHDFGSHNLLPGASFHSLPPTLVNSEADLAQDHAPNMVPQSQPEFIRPAPRLGRMTSTPDSFCQITLDLASRITTWGRSPLNTIIYPDHLDTRIPKRGIMLYFHGKGIERVEKTSGDWTKLPDLHCLIATDSSNGISINDIKLQAKDVNGKQLYGRVYTGDEITICAGNNKDRILKFMCAFNHGEAKEPRSENGPRFEVEKMEHDK